MAATCATDVPLDRTLAASYRQQVEDMFDDYAPDFEHSLVTELKYGIPQQLQKQLVKRKLQKRDSGAVADLDCEAECHSSELQSLEDKVTDTTVISDRITVDLGCGTGLAGKALRQNCIGKVIGCDLSRGMLKRAKRKQYTVTPLHRRQLQGSGGGDPGDKTTVSPQSNRDCDRDRDGSESSSAPLTGNKGVTVTKAGSGSSFGGASGEPVNSDDVRNVYDELHACDAVACLAKHVKPGTVDLIVAADVIIYMRGLKDLVNAAEAALCPGGVFAFSTEVCTLEEAGGIPPVGCGWVQRPSERIAHCEEYIRWLVKPPMGVQPDLIHSESEDDNVAHAPSSRVGGIEGQRHSLVLESLQEVTVRHDNDREIRGHLVVLSKPTRIV